MRRAHYITNERVETALYLALVLEKPLLIEGTGGRGQNRSRQGAGRKCSATELVRLQCYEGLDEARALYEWNYQKQLLRLQADEQQGLGWDQLSQHIFSREYLLERPLLKAISSPRKVVLLIDEIDKADEEFEAFLLELLSDFQISIPELGTIRAQERPAVVLTSNRARELSDALRRRCLHLFIDFPGIEQERRILELKIPGLDATWPRRRRASSIRCASSIWPSSPPSPRRWTGSARWSSWASKRSTSRRSAPRWACCSSMKATATLVETKAAAIIPRTRQAR